MEFAVIAYDAQDEQALERRMAVREDHMRYIEKLRTAGHMIHGGALMNDEGKMIGSIVICDFPTQDAFQAWLQSDPYVTGNVWKDIQVMPFKTAPPFINNIPKSPTAPL